MSMKFAHMSDCHIGSWQRTAVLTDASINAFERALDTAVSEKVDFILISGDLFDTSIPAVDKLKQAVLKLKDIKDKGVPVYLIAGSHDYSPTGKTMLDVLENAGLFVNVYKTAENEELQAGEAGQKGKMRLRFTVDAKTGAKIAGVLGKKGGLERESYSDLDKESLENEQGFKIFMFHSGIEEYKPKHLELMEAVPLSDFPKGFGYYAAGHIHHVFSKKEPGYGVIAFPGPLFPNNFDELERLNCGGFYIVEQNPGQELKLRHIRLPVFEFYPVKMDCDGKTPGQVQEALMDEARNGKFDGKIVGMRLYGKIKSGKTTDISFREITQAFADRGAACVLRNAYALTSEFFEEIKTEASSMDDIEAEIIRQHLGLVEFFNGNELETTRALIEALGKEKDEGERQPDFERRVIHDIEKILKAKLL